MKKQPFDTTMWKRQALSRCDGAIDFIVRHSGKFFVVALVMISLLAIVAWNQYYRTLGDDESKIQTLLSEKKDIVFDESLHSMLVKQWHERENARDETFSAKSIPFVFSEK